MKTKTTKLPKLLVIRPFRAACRVFYSKFTKFDVTYLTVGDSPEIKNNFRVVNTSYYPKIGKVNNLSWVFMKDMERFVKETDIVCISDNYYFFNLQAILLAKRYNKKVVTILWATIPNHISNWLPPYSFITRKVIVATDLFILRNTSAIPFATSLGAPKGKIKVVYKGIDLAAFCPRKQRNSKIINILYVGKIINSKGVDDLKAAFKMLIKDRLNVKLSLVSGVSYAKLPEVYRSADIFCSPSKEINLLGVKIWEEYFSYTLMEAQASGLPIVTTRSVGTIEEVDPRNEFIDKGDVLELYKSLKKLVLDKKLRNKLSVINRERAEKLFNAEIQAKKTESEILKLC
jgi:glycosyltransferase involved in cell wall biosynthesis